MTSLWDSLVVYRELKIFDKGVLDNSLSLIEYSFISFIVLSKEIEVGVLFK